MASIKAFAGVLFAAGLFLLWSRLPIGPAAWHLVRWAFYIPVVLAGARFGSVAGLLSGVGASFLCAFQAGGMESGSQADLFAPDLAIVGFMSGRVLARQPRSLLLQSARRAPPDSASLSEGTRNLDLNPLISIESSAKLLGEEDTPTHVREELVGIISKECQHLSTRISSMLQRIEEGPAEFCAADLAAIIDDAQCEAAFVLCGQGTALRKEVSPDLPQIQCNPAQIRKLLMLLIIYAAQSAPAGAEVVLRAYPQGAGSILDLRHLGHTSLFGRLSDLILGSRLDLTGESLSSVFEIVRNHRGTIESKLTARKGLEFSVWLPKLHSDDLNGERRGDGDRG